VTLEGPAGPRIIYVNDAWLKMIGYGRHAGKLSATHDAEPNRKMSQRGQPLNLLTLSFAHFNQCFSCLKPRL
jgi:hypothetical protein